MSNALLCFYSIPMRDTENIFNFMFMFLWISPPSAKRNSNTYKIPLCYSLGKREYFNGAKRDQLFGSKGISMIYSQGRRVWVFNQCRCLQFDSYIVVPLSAVYFQMREPSHSMHYAEVFPGTLRRCREPFHWRRTSAQGQSGSMRRAVENESVNGGRSRRRNPNMPSVTMHGESPLSSREGGA